MPDETHPAKAASTSCHMGMQCSPGLPIPVVQLRFGRAQGRPKDCTRFLIGGHSRIELGRIPV